MATKGDKLVSEEVENAVAVLRSCGYNPALEFLLF